MGRLRASVRAAFHAWNTHGAAPSGPWVSAPDTGPARSDEEASGARAEVEATVLGVLLETDQSSNENVQQATIAIVATVLAYLGATLFVVGDPDRTLALGVLLALPAPPLLLQTLQMVWAGGVLARASSAELIEEALVARADPSTQARYRDGLIGSRRTTRLTDVRHAGGLTAAADFLPYVGFYLLTFAFVVHVLYEAWALVGSDPDGRRWWVFAVLCYSGYTVFFVAVARRIFSTALSKDASAPSALVLSGRASRLMSGVIAMLALSGVIAQNVQQEDLTRAAAYFTVWSAAAAGITWLALDLTGGHPRVRPWCAAASVGSLLSGLVFWLGMFPLNGLGVSFWLVTANVTLHLAVPLALLMRLAIGQRSWTIPRGQASWTLLYPATFVVVTVVWSATSGVPSPYLFLRPQDNAWLFGAFCVAFAGLWLLCLRLWVRKPAA